ncbi:MAG: hypothetical protein A4E31_00338 [Methanomassiliicoccales archaeon PtaU1.Bin030]|jgi:uncharacterized membrane-anchored protein|nr:MAG: hypothetical protein A4E31_00338 [Methanomassiliicoccales archaeon PtaU1.Bin030]
MARKKRKEEKEPEYEWVPPEFDEKAFLVKDIVGTKALMLTAVIAVAFGVAAALIGNAVGVIVSLIIYLIGAVTLNYVLRYMKISMSDIDKKTMIGNLALYMLLALGIWILLINEPFM